MQDDDPTPPADSLPELQDVDLRRRLLGLVVSVAIVLVVGLFSIRDQMIVRHEMTWPATPGAPRLPIPSDAESTLTLRLNLELRGIRAGLVPSFRTQSITATWRGRRSRAAAVYARDYQGVLDFSGRGPGAWTLPVLVTGPDSRRLVLEPDSVRVVLRELPAK